MGKRSRTKARRAQHESQGDQPAARQPCPCGSGRRYKACHGSPSGPPPTYVSRPFEGLAGECDVIAMREFVPAATADLAVTGQERSVLLCSLLPTVAPALVREDGTVWLGLQVQHSFGDPSRDLAAVLSLALQAPVGERVGLTAPPGDGPRMQDLVTTERLQVTVHESFDFWVADVWDPDGSLHASLEQANAAVQPTDRLTSVEAAYWTDTGSKEHLRWVLPHPEEEALTALARLHAAEADELVAGSRLVGSFRAHGRVVPVWDLPRGTGAEALEQPAETFAERLGEALRTGAPLSSAERKARSGLAHRQLTLR